MLPEAGLPGTPSLLSLGSVATSSKGMGTGSKRSSVGHNNGRFSLGSLLERFQGRKLLDEPPVHLVLKKKSAKNKDCKTG